METKTMNLTCIRCPMGCSIRVELADGAVTSVTGNTCPRGAAYAEKEVTNPQRMVTTTVSVTQGTELRSNHEKMLRDCVRTIREAAGRRALADGGGDILLSTYQKYTKKTDAEDGSHDK